MLKSKNKVTFLNYSYNSFYDLHLVLLVKLQKFEHLCPTFDTSLTASSPIQIGQKVALCMNCMHCNLAFMYCKQFYSIIDLKLLYLQFSIAMYEKLCLKYITLGLCGYHIVCKVSAMQVITCYEYH